jgi:hypothetical protein
VNIADIEKGSLDFFELTANALLQLLSQIAHDAGCCLARLLLDM